MIRRLAVLYWAAALSAVAVSCASRSEDLSPQLNSTSELELRGIGVDEQRDGLVVVSLADGSMLLLNEGMRLLNGRPISCAELKVMATFLFQKLGDRRPYFDADCRRAD